VLVVVLVLVVVVLVLVLVVLVVGGREIERKSDFEIHGNGRLLMLKLRRRSSDPGGSTKSSPETFVTRVICLVTINLRHSFSWTTW
jgi:hypothetical protein